MEGEVDAFTKVAWREGEGGGGRGRGNVVRRGRAGLALVTKRVA
jgi:hypothetical protein